MLFSQSPESISIETFLKDYWQKKPLLIRNALPNFKDPISPEELAGLACEDAIESRLIFNRNIKNNSTDKNNSADTNKWELKNGPFEEADFTSLPQDNWTLLVQSVDPWFPKIKQLIDSVGFLPSWRIDDVMVSYAEKNAGAGPHFDYYDVFIIQGQGTRTWKIGQRCSSDTELSDNTELKLIKHFETNTEWKLRSGDALYIPPGLAHYGIAHDSSLSYSIGFRAPSLSEMIISYSDEICAGLNEDQRYTDPTINNEILAGEISSADLAQAEKLISAALLQPEKIRSWFGKHMTETKLPGLLIPPEQILSSQALLAALTNGEQIQKHPVSRSAWTCQDDHLVIFVDGENFSFDCPSAPLLALNEYLNSKQEEISQIEQYLKDPSCLNLLCDLYNQGSIVFKE